MYILHCSLEYDSLLSQHEDYNCPVGCLQGISFLFILDLSHCHDVIRCNMNRLPHYLIPNYNIIHIRNLSHRCNNAIISCHLNRFIFILNIRYYFCKALLKLKLFLHNIVDHYLRLLLLLHSRSIFC